MVAKRKAKREGVPWAHAVGILGSEDALLRGVSANVVWNWRQRKRVPAEHVLERFHAQVIAERAGQKSSASAHPVQAPGAPVVTLSAPEAEMIADLTKHQDAWRLLTEIWQAQKTQPEMVRYWNKIIDEIRFAHSFIKSPEKSPAPSQRRRPLTG